MPTQLNGAKKVVVVDDGTNEKFVALGKWTATDSASSVIQTSSDASTWTKMDYVSDPYGGAFRDGLITDEFDGETFGEHVPPGTFYTDIGLPSRLFRIPTLSEYPGATWKKFRDNTTNANLIGLSGNLTTQPGFAYSVLSTSAGIAWITGVLLVPTSIASDEEWVDIHTVLVGSTLYYVAITNYGQVATSTNGYTWTYSSFNSLITLSGEKIQAVQTYNGVVYAVSNRNVYTTSNLSTWVKDTTPWASYTVADVLIDNGYIMIISSDAQNILMRYKYISGGTWTSTTTPGGAALSMRKILPFGTKYHIFSATDGYVVEATKNTGSPLNAPGITWTRSQRFNKAPTTVIAWPGSGNTMFAFESNSTHVNHYSYNTTTGFWTFYNTTSIPDSKKPNFDASTRFSSFVLSYNDAALGQIDRVLLIDNYGNSYYKNYIIADGYYTPSDPFTPDLNDAEYQALADQRITLSENTTRYQQYIGFYGAGNRFPDGSAWDLMATNSARKVALNVGTTTTAYNDNYEVMIPGGTMKNARSWKDITWGANKFVAIAQNGFEWSVSGVIWNTCVRPSDASDYVWKTITYLPSNGAIPGRYYTIAENSNKSMTSLDGINWSYSGTLPTTDSDDWNHSVSSSTATVVVKDNANTIAYIDHAAVDSGWVSKTLPSTQDWRDVAFGYEKSEHTGSASTTTQYTSPALAVSLADGYVKHNIKKDRMSLVGSGVVALTPVSLVSKTGTANAGYTYKQVKQNYTFKKSDAVKVNSTDHWPSSWSDSGMVITGSTTTTYNAGGIQQIQYSNTMTLDQIQYSSGWLVGDQIRIKGSKFVNGVDGTNDLTFTITGIDSNGSVISWTKSFVVPAGSSSDVGGGFQITATRNTSTGAIVMTIDDAGAGYVVGDVLPITIPYAYDDQHNLRTGTVYVTAIGSGGSVTAVGYAADGSDPLNMNRSARLSTGATITYSGSTSGTTASDINAEIRLTTTSGQSPLTFSGDQFKILGTAFPGYATPANDVSLTIGSQNVWTSTNIPTNLEFEIRTTPGNQTPTIGLINGGSGYNFVTGCTIKSRFVGGNDPSPENQLTINFTKSGGVITALALASSSELIIPPVLPTFTVGKNGTTYNNLTLVSAGSGISAGTQFKILGTVFNGTTPTNDITITASTVNAPMNAGTEDNRVLTASMSGTASFTAATFKITRNKTAQTFEMLTAGAGHIAGNPVKILGSVINGINGTHDMTITPLTVSATGAILTYSTSYTGYEGRFVALATGPNGAYSLDGKTWVETTMSSNQVWLSIEYGGTTAADSRFVAVVDNSDVYATSVDGVTWTQATLPKSSTWKQVVFFKNRFILLDGSRYPMITNVISSSSLVWSDYGEEYISYWASTEMTDIVYIGGKYIGVGYGTLLDGTTIPLVWKSTTLSGAKASWRLYGTASDLGQLSNIINVSGDFAFIAEDNAGTPANAVKKFTTTFINDTTTTGYLIPLSQTSDFPGSDSTGYSKIEATGGKLYLTKKNGSVITYDIS